MVTTWKSLPRNEPDFDEENDIVIRQSLIGQLQLCAGRVGFQNHEGYLESVSEPLVFGQCVHHIIAEDLIHDEQQDKLLQSMGDWVDEILHEQYDWSLKQVPDVPKFFSEIGVAYRLWRKTVRPKLSDILSIEEEQTLFLGEGRQSNIWLQGTGDVVTATSLVDWKTSGRGWKQVKADVSIQASLYMPLTKQNLGESIRKFTFWVFNRQAGAWQRHVTHRKVEQIDSALATAYQHGLQLEAEVFPCTPVPESSFNKKRGWYCSPKFCGAWNICDAKYMNDGKDEKVVAVRSW